MPLQPGEDFNEHFLSADLTWPGVIGARLKGEMILGDGITVVIQSGKPKYEHNLLLNDS